MGIMASKSAQQHIADAKAFIARGGTLGEYISQMQRIFRRNQSTKRSLHQEVQDWQKLTDTTLYNQKTGEIRNLSGTSGWIPSSFTEIQLHILLLKSDSAHKHTKIVQEYGQSDMEQPESMVSQYSHDKQLLRQKQKLLKKILHP